MAYFKTYIGARVDLEHFKDSSISYEIELINSDGTDTDLTVYDDIVMFIKHKIHGTIVCELSLDNDGLNFGSPIGNTIFINTADYQLNIRPKDYYHETYGYKDGDKDILFHGVSKVL